jgi:uncharacterized membrane protein (UPF0127 family)
MPRAASARTGWVRKARSYSFWPYVAIVAAILAIIVLALTVGDSKSKPNTNAKKQNTAVNTACGPYRVDKIIRIGDQQFQTEVARDNAGFTKGLGGRPCILSNQAMLFPFSKPATIPIWMKDMKFPIDVVWITASHKIAAIEIDFQPSTYPEKRINQIPAQYVLELKANRTTELGLNIGSTINL